MKELFQLLKDKGISPNSWYLLQCLESNLNIELPISQSTEIKRLQLMKLIDDDMKPTTEGLLVLEDINKVFSKTGTRRSIKQIDPEFSENLTAYRNLFPNSRVAGKMVRNSVLDLEPRMIWFFKTFPEYTWDHVLGATQKYLESMQGEYKYCMTSAYFIKKDDKTKSSLSLLSSWCEAELTQEEDPDASRASAVLGFNRLI